MTQENPAPAEDGVIKCRRSSRTEADLTAWKLGLAYAVTDSGQSGGRPAYDIYSTRVFK